MEPKTYNPGLYDATVREAIRKRQENVSKFNNKGFKLLFTDKVLDAINLYLIPFESNNKIGFINKEGTVIIKPIYDQIKGCFYTEDNLVAVKKEEKWSVIDACGKELLPFDYNHIFISPDSKLVSFQIGWKSWKVIDLDSNTNEIVKNEYEYIEGFRYGYARIKKNGKWGIIDKTGKIVLPAEYESVYDFYNWPTPTTIIQKDKNYKSKIINLNDLNAPKI